MPVILNLLNQAIGVLLGALLDLLALGAEVALETRRIPLVVGLHDIVVPVVLDEVFEILAVCWFGVRDVVV